MLQNDDDLEMEGEDGCEESCLWVVSGLCCGSVVVLTLFYCFFHVLGHLDVLKHFFLLLFF